MTATHASAVAPREFRIPLGVSVASSRERYLSGEACVMGVLATGAVGTGKTSWIKSVIAELFRGDESNRPGAMIVNVKDDYGTFVTELAARCDQQDRVVHLRSGGVDSMNILAPSLTPHKLAQMLVTATQNFQTRDEFWPSSAQHLLTDEIGLLRLAYGDDQVTMTDVISLGSTLQAFVNRNPIGRKSPYPKEVEFLLQVAASRIDALALARERDDARKRLGEFAEIYARWCGLADRTFSSVAMTASLTLSCCEPPEIASVLAARPDRATFSGIQEILEQGKIVVCDFSAQRDGLVGKMAGAVLKRQLFAAALTSRHGIRDENARSVYLIADEAQAHICLDDASEADHNFSALARSLKVGLIYCTQSLDAIAGSDWQSNGAASTLLRNLRNHLYFRQDGTPTLAQVMQDRGLPLEAVRCAPNLRQFHALVSTKGNIDEGKSNREEPDFDHCYLTPPHLHNVCANIGCECTAPPHALATRVRGWLDNAIVRSGDSTSQCVIASDDAALLRRQLAEVDRVLRNLGYATVRVAAEDLDRLDPVEELLAAAGWSPRALLRSAVLVENLERLPAGQAAMNNIRKLYERRSPSVRVPGHHFDFGRVVIISSLNVGLGEGTSIGFRPGQQTAKVSGLPLRLPWDLGDIYDLDDVGAEANEGGLSNERC